MADLTFLERRNLENLFDMGSGYVLDFSNRTFSDFLGDSFGIDPYDAKYEKGGHSKANRLRTIWEIEPNYLVGRLIFSLLEYIKETGIDRPAQKRDEALKISERLLRGASVADLSALSQVSDDRDFEVLAKEIKSSIDKNQPEAALDRLHTFVVKYMRGLCEKQQIEAGREKPLHSLMGEYVKCLKRRNLLESLMSERILKSSISVLEAFNEVRNEQSLAHDNANLLNHSESLLIFNHVASVVRFIVEIERRCDPKPDVSVTGISSLTDDDIPF